MRFTRCLLSTWRAVQECHAVIQSDLNLTLFALLTYDYLTADNSFCNARISVTQSLPHQRPPSGIHLVRIISDDDCRSVYFATKKKKMSSPPSNIELEEVRNILQKSAKSLNSSSFFHYLQLNWSDIFIRF